jgi:succinyl-CoA synthetase beta subunit
MFSSPDLNISDPSSALRSNPDPAMSRTLSEAESKSALAPFGIPFLPESNVTTAIEAVEAATTLGYPVVAKLCGDSIAHKTERGLVRLMLQSETELTEAVESLLAAATPADGDVTVLVAPMVRATRELIAGIAADDQFGLTVVVGIGGIFTEVLADVSIRLVPITELDAREMIDDLRMQSFLGEFRGESGIDRGALVKVLLALSDFATSRADIVSVDLNPLMIVDGMPVAVDALVEVASVDRTGSR